MSLKDFLWGSKKSWKYQTDYNSKKPEPIVKKDPLKENVQKHEEPVKSYDKTERQQIYGRRIETDSKPQGFKREFYEIRKPICKDVVVIVIENSSYTRDYKEKILQLTRKIIDSNNECFFLLVRIGDDKKIYDIASYDLLDKKQILDNWFSETIAQPCDYLEVIKYLEDYYRTLILGFEFLDINGKDAQKYSIQNINVVFVGSGNTSLDKETKKECAQLLNKLKGKMRIKSIKYFCTLDTQTINVAKLGFPVIGHIETDFYK